jgi:hypothetical protein
MESIKEEMQRRMREEEGRGGWGGREREGGRKKSKEG